MTVKELIEELQQYDPNLPVAIEMVPTGYWEEITDTGEEEGQVRIWN